MTDVDNMSPCGLGGGATSLNGHITLAALHHPITQLIQLVRRRALGDGRSFKEITAGRDHAAA
jgi:hypothetical protein